MPGSRNWIKFLKKPGIFSKNRTRIQEWAVISDKTVDILQKSYQDLGMEEIFPDNSEKMVELL